MVKSNLPFPHEFVNAYLGLVAEYLPGETTLNQIRILQYIGWQSALIEGQTFHSDICQALGMSASTVTRAIGSFIEVGILTEKVDPNDGRRRCVMMSTNYPARGTLDVKVIAMARRYFRGRQDGAAGHAE